MIYSLSLHTAGLAVGLLLIAIHAIALINAREIRKLLLGFPRSKVFGIALMTVDAIWAFVLIAKIDLGEFTSWRQTILIAIFVAWILTIKFVDEFLSVRALGILCLLAAEPVLEAAFLRPETSRLLLTALAYAWATLGIFWVGMPYLLRDQIGWISKTDLRWRASALAGIAYGAAVLGCALTQWGG